MFAVLGMGLAAPEQLAAANADKQGKTASQESPAIMMNSAQTQNDKAKTQKMNIISDKTEGGVRYVTAIPEGVCSRKIDVAVKDGIILSASYTGGCNGNLKGISALLKGMKVEDAIKKLEGITCGSKPTSCPDQLARLLKSL